MIPRVLHQTWKDERVPERWRRLQRTWREHHPGWRHRLWTDADLRALVAGHYPWLLPTYDAYDYPISRVDAARYLLLHRFGGVYVDLDFECLRPLEPLLEGRELVLGAEPEAHRALPVVQRRAPGLRRIVCNAFIASRPGHPFWEHVFQRLLVHARDESALDVAGPLFLSRAVEAWGEEGAVHVAPAEQLYPLDKEATAALGAEGAAGRAALPREAYAVHHWAGSWVADFQAALARRSDGPRPPSRRF